MSITRSERRQIENEMIFRRSNEKVVDTLDELDEMHAEDGNFDLMKDEDLELHFNCECSDENCVARIPLALTKYQEIHKKRDVFIIIPGHEVDSIEKVVDKTSAYTVVRKNQLVAETSGKLHATDIDNT